MRSKKTGILLSYLFVIATTVSNVALIPFYLRYLGMNDYGLYQYVYSIAQYAIVLDFGIASIMVKHLVKCKVQGDEAGEENFAAHGLLITFSACILIVTIGAAVYLNLQAIIVNRTPEEMAIAREIFWFMIGRILLGIVQHYSDGVLLANERYAVERGFAVARVVTKSAAIVAMVLLGGGIMGIVLGDFIASALCLLASLWYAFFKVRFKIRWRFFDKPLFRSALILAFTLMLQSIALYANTALSRYILGSLTDNVAVGLYSIALSISMVFTDMTNAVNAIFMPRTTQLLEAGATNERITDFVISVGRLQCVLCLGMLCGFALLGRQFIAIWSGPDTAVAWVIALILMVPAALPLLEGTCQSVLTVRNKRLFRSLMLIGVAAVNVFISFFLVRRIGILGAPIGTAIALLLGNGLAMNIYYKKVMGLSVGRMIRGIFSGIWIAALAASVACLPFALLPNRGIWWFLLGAAVFCCVYGLALYGVGLKKEEKAMIVKTLRKAVGRAEG